MCVCVCVWGGGGGGGAVVSSVPRCQELEEAMAHGDTENH